MNLTVLLLASRSSGPRQTGVPYAANLKVTSLLFPPSHSAGACEAALEQGASASARPLTLEAPRRLLLGQAMACPCRCRCQRRASPALRHSVTALHCCFQTSARASDLRHRGLIACVSAAVPCPQSSLLGFGLTVLNPVQGEVVLR